VASFATGKTLDMRSRENPAPQGWSSCHDVEMTGTDTRGLRSAAPLVLLSAVVVLVTFGFARGFWLSNMHNGLLALAFAGVGAYVLFQRPGHREGMLFMATGVVEAVTFFGRQVGHSPTLDASRWWAWLGVWPVVVALALTTLSVICFPDGLLPSSRWRWVAAAVIAVTVVCATMSALWPVEYDAAGLTARHPVNADAPTAVSHLWSAIAHPVYAVFQVLWLVAVLARWRSSDGYVRRQVAWLVLAAGCSAIALGVGLAGWGTPRPGILSATLIPLAAGWAIVHGQHVAAYSALTWLSRSEPLSGDLPRAFAQAVAQALSAPGAILWMGPPDDLHAVGVWPESAESIGPERPLALVPAPDRLLRTVWRGDEPVGAISVDRSRTDSLSLAEKRMLDDLGAQAAFVIEHQSLADVIARQQRAGYLDGLSPREQEVLKLLARGLSNSAICQELHLSIKTVEPVVSAIFAKLGLHSDVGSNRRVLAVLAYLRG
jgi:DNA-binding CsgD family transcriptional regulator/branched-subunit amino acid transport protein